MASLRDLKLRIRSIKSTQKIARAMEMVSAAKMRKAQHQALVGRPYLNKLREMLSSLIYSSEPKLTHKFLDNKEEKTGRIAYIIISADRGLCGAFNSNVIRMTLDNFSGQNASERRVVTVGKKIFQSMNRLGQNVSGNFIGLSNLPKFADTIGIASMVKDQYLRGEVDEVYLIYNHFYTTAVQKPIMHKLLPIEPAREQIHNDRKTEYIFEGDKQKLLDELLHRLIDTNVYQAVLESSASEHSARMLAMHKASDSAKEIVTNLSLEYNKGRQAKITTSLLEIVAGTVVE